MASVSEIERTGSTGFSLEKGFYCLREKIKGNLKQAYPDCHSLMSALILGDKTELTFMETANITNAGLSHIIAVSGFHVSIFIAFISVLLKPIKNKKVKNIIFILSVIFLSSLCAMTPSVLRASLMAGITFIANISENKADSLNNLGIAATLLLLFSPELSVSASFILSVSATLGIILLSRRVLTGLNMLFIKTALKKPSVITEYLLSIISVSVCAYIFTFPIGLFYFKEMSGITLISNLICLPLIEIIFPLFLVLIIFSFFRLPGGVYLLLNKIGAFFTFIFFKAVSFLAYFEKYIPNVISYILFAILIYCICANPLKKKIHSIKQNKLSTGGRNNG